MPARSLSSSVHRWPDAGTVRGAALEWARREAASRPGLVRLGYFGSYARGDWGPGSDLDLVAVVRTSALPFAERAVEWPVDRLPVPAQILVYTDEEWARLRQGGGRFARMLSQEAVWLVGAA